MRTEDLENPDSPNPSKLMNPSLRGLVWRWHFYAGLFTAPFLILLGVTGGLYLFQDEITAATQKEFLYVSPANASPLAAGQLAARVLEERSGATWSEYAPPLSPDRSARVRVQLPEGAVRDVFVDPYSGTILGETDPDKSLFPVLRQLHSLSILGPYASGFIEAVAGWVVLLGISGVAVAWPIRVPRLMPRNPRSRAFWRSTHVLCGASAGMVLVFLALTGLPWSGVWGTAYKSVSRAMGQGSPKHIWEGRPQSTLPASLTATRAWTVEQLDYPSSTGTEPSPIELDAVLAVVADAGMHDISSIGAPWGPTGVYTALYLPDRPSGQRVIHVDQYSGEIVEKIDFQDFGSMAMLTEWGISVHMGRAFGPLNKAIMLFGCVAAIVMPVSGAAMWWRRRVRPARGAGLDAAAPPGKLMAVCAAIALLFPLTALSMLPMIVADAFYTHFRRQAAAQSEEAAIELAETSSVAAPHLGHLDTGASERSTASSEA